MYIKTTADIKIHLSKAQEARRRRYIRLMGAIPFFFPRRVQIDPELFERVCRFSRDGGGVLFSATHFSQREVFDLVLIAAGFQPLLARRGDFPVALHQSNNRLLRFLAGKISVNFWPVFTDDTVQALQSGKFKWDSGGAPDHRELVALNEAYFAAARECLSIGGTVFVAIKPGRRPALELTNDKPLQRVLMSKDAQGHLVDESNAILVLMGASMHDSQSETHTANPSAAEVGQRAADREFYQAHRGSNLFRKLDFHINIALTQSERRALCAATGLTIDHVATALLATQVDPRYNAVPAGVVQQVRAAYRDLKPEARDK